VYDCLSSSAPARCASTAMLQGQQSWFVLLLLSDSTRTSVAAAVYRSAASSEHGCLTMCFVLLYIPVDPGKGCVLLPGPWQLLTCWHSPKS
jgi:hypothetical protein